METSELLGWDTIKKRLKLQDNSFLNGQIVTNKKCIRPEEMTNNDGQRQRQTERQTIRLNRNG